MPYGAISYSLFGLGRQYKDSFTHRDYLRGLEFNIRTALLVYPAYKVVANIDQETYDAYKNYFDEHRDRGYLDYFIHSRAELCRNMLWRMSPIWENYDRVLCRDTDSLVSVREAKCVREWEKSGRIAHSMADSISHTEVLMGGMIGFASKEFKIKIKCESFKEFMMLGKGYDFNIKGSDQKFLNREVLPKVAESLTEHHMLGLPNSFRGMWSNKVPDEDMGFPPEYDETSHCAFHIGASGMKETALLKFLNEFGMDNNHFERIEKKYATVFYWML